MKNIQTTFAIGIPTINRADLLQETLEKYSIDFPNTLIYVIDNGYQKWETQNLSKNIKFIVNATNLGVASSCNVLMNKIYNGSEIFPSCIYSLILNDDIYFGKTEEQVLKFIVENDSKFISSTIDWCAFLCMKQLFNKIGLFDYNFWPAYFEDDDYKYRCKLNNEIIIESDFLDPLIYRNSQSIAKNPELNKNFENNKKYYIEKWGEVPQKEIFITPFNKK